MGGLTARNTVREDEDLNQPKIIPERIRMMFKQQSTTPPFRVFKSIHKDIIMNHDMFLDQIGQF